MPNGRRTPKGTTSMRPSRRDQLARTTSTSSRSCTYWASNGSVSGLPMSRSQALSHRTVLLERNRAGTVASRSGASSSTPRLLSHCSVQNKVEALFFSDRGLLLLRSSSLSRDRSPEVLDSCGKTPLPVASTSSSKKEGMLLRSKLIL
jgi:hypothetical protein